MVRWLNIAARGWIAVPGWRSTVSDGTPLEASRSDADRPTRLPPTTRTGTSSRMALELLERAPCENAREVRAVLAARAHVDLRIGALRRESGRVCGRRPARKRLLHGRRPQ